MNSSGFAMLLLALLPASGKVVPEPKGSGMADIINLRQARKARARSEAEAKAAANRVRFGRTAQEKQISKTEARRADKLLDGVKRDD